MDRPAREECHEDAPRRRTVAAQGRALRLGYYHEQNRDGDSGRRRVAAVVVSLAFRIAPYARMGMFCCVVVPARGIPRRSRRRDPIAGTHIPEAAWPPPPPGARPPFGGPPPPRRRARAAVVASPPPPPLPISK